MTRRAQGVYRVYVPWWMLKDASVAQVRRVRRVQQMRRVATDGGAVAGAEQTHLELSAIRHRPLHRRLRHPLQRGPATSQPGVLACGDLAGKRNLHCRARKIWAEVWGEIWAGPAGRGFVSAGGRRRVGARRLVRGAYFVLGKGFDPCDLRVLGDGGAPGGLG